MKRELLQILCREKDAEALVRIPVILFDFIVHSEHRGNPSFCVNLKIGSKMIFLLYIILEVS